MFTENLTFVYGHATCQTFKSPSPAPSDKSLISASAISGGSACHQVMSSFRSHHPSSSVSTSSASFTLAASDVLPPPAAHSAKQQYQHYQHSPTLSLTHTAREQRTNACYRPNNSMNSHTVTSPAHSIHSQPPAYPGLTSPNGHVTTALLSGAVL